MTTRTSLVRLFAPFLVASALLLITAGSASANVGCPGLLGPLDPCANMTVHKLVSVTGAPGSYFRTQPDNPPVTVAGATRLYYEIQVSNPGNHPYQVLTVLDAECTSGPMSLTPTSGDTNTSNRVDPGETWHYFCSRLLTGLEVSPYVNHAFVTGKTCAVDFPQLLGCMDPIPTALNGDEIATVRFIKPALNIVKTGTPGSAHVGDTVTFGYDVTNPSNSGAPLHDVVVDDDICAPVSSLLSGDTNNNGVLDPGETWHYTCTYAVLSSAGSSIVNKGTVTAKDELNNTLTKSATHTTTVLRPSYTVEKEAPPYVKAGKDFSWTINVENTGNAALTVTLNDNQCDLNPTTTAIDNTYAVAVAVGEIKVVKCKQTAPNDKTVFLPNLVCATAVDSIGGPGGILDEELCARASTTVLHPQLLVTKTVDKLGAAPLDVLNYTITVENTGDTLLYITPRDYDCSNFDTQQTSWTLGPGSYFTFHCSHTYKPFGPYYLLGDGRKYTNEACAYGNVEFGTLPSGGGGNLNTFSFILNPPPPQADASDCDSATSKLAHVKIEKRLVRDNDLKYTPEDVHAGEVLTFHYAVINDGEAPLHNVGVVDDKCSPLSSPLDEGFPAPAILVKGAEWDYTCTYTVPANAAPGAELINNAKVTALPDGGSQVTNDDEFEIEVIKPEVHVLKWGPATPDKGVAVASEPVLWHIQVVNDSPNTNVHFTLSDLGCDGLDTSSIYLHHGNTSTEYTCVMQPAHDQWPNPDTFMANKACAHVTDHLGGAAGTIDPCSDVIKVPVVHPDLRVTKQVDTSGTLPPDPANGHYADVGSAIKDTTLVYKITVENIGDVELDVHATDPGCIDPGTSQPPDHHVNLVPAPSTSPDPSTFVFYCRHDFDPAGTDGQASLTAYANQACAHGHVSDHLAGPRPPGPREADTAEICDTVTTHLKGSLTIDKTVSDEYAHEGDHVIYTYTVTNGTEVPLTGVNVVDNKCSPMTAPTHNGHAAGSTMGVSEVWVFTCDYVIPDTPNYGSVTNSATAFGTDPGLVTDGVESKPDTAEVTVIHPSLIISKSHPAAFGLAGEAILWEITVTNTGDTDLETTISDTGCTGQAGMTMPLPTDSVVLAAADQNATPPGPLTYHPQTFQCGTGFLDVDKLTNTACATGIDRLGRPEGTVTTDPCGISTIDLKHPALTVEKVFLGTDGKVLVDTEGNPIRENAAATGDKVRYQVTVTNSGDVEMWVHAWDPNCYVSSGDLSKALDPGKQIVFACSHYFPSYGFKYVNKACAAGWVPGEFADPRPPEHGIGYTLENGHGEADAYGCDEVVTHRLGEVELEVTAHRPGDEAEISQAHEGDPILWDFEIHNTGTQPLTNLVVKDERCKGVLIGPLDASGTPAYPAGQPIPMPPDAHWEFECADTVPAWQGDPPPTTNLHDEATLTATSPGDGHVSAPDPPAEWDITILHPHLTIVKWGTKIAVAGEDIPYSIKVTNDGDAYLPNVTLSDPGCDGLPHSSFSMDVGDVNYYHCKVLAANDPGLLTDLEHTNIACVTGIDEVGGPKGTYTTAPEDCGKWTTKLVHPSLSVTKTVDEATADPGDTLHYHITVTNTGDIEQWVEASDYGCDSTSIKSASYLNVDQSLDKGESVTFDCTHLFTKDDGKSYTNEACANGWVDIWDGIDHVYWTQGNKNDEIASHACGKVTTKLAEHHVSGQVFEDQSANHQHDPGEPGLGGWLIYADLNDNGKKDPNEPSGVSDAGGGFSVPVDLGTTIIRAQVPDPFTCSMPTACAYTVNLPKNANARVFTRDASARAVDPSAVDFGGWQHAKVAGSVFTDTNHDGVHQTGEPAIFNLPVYADANNNGVQDVGELVTTTGTDGAYVLPGFTPGTYVIRPQPIAGNDCTAPATCSYMVTLTSGATAAPKDFLSAPHAAGQAVLGARITPGTARLSGKTGCVNHSFSAKVAGTKIARVTFKLDGYTIAGSRVSAAGDWSVRINPASLKKGKHKLVARVVFTTKSKTKPKTLRLTFQRCGRQLVAPQFTAGA